MGAQVNGRPSNSAADYFFRVNSLGGVAGVDDELRFAHDLCIVVVGMIGENQHAVVLRQIVERYSVHVEIVVAAASYIREKGVVVRNDGASLLQQFDDRERG